MASSFILAGDIGGTTARFALFASGSTTGARLAARAPAFESFYAGHDFPDFDAALARFRDESGIAAGKATITRACLGAAGAVEGNRIKLTNAPWSIDADAVSACLDGAPVLLLNDFEAAAHGVESLAPRDLTTLQAGQPRAAGAQVVIGAGTGLGVAYRVANDAGYQVVAGEGGHAGFAPTDAEQAGLMLALLAELGRVSVEHVVSGAGLERIHAFVRRKASGGGHLAAAEVARLALEEADSTALHALDLFIACYGAVAGDHALAVRASGGVYIAGGIAAKILPRLAAGGFIAAFNAKGVRSALAKSFPVHVVTTERLGLLGAACAALREGQETGQDARTRRN